MSKQGKRIQVTVPSELMELAKIVGCTPSEILEQFVQDLLRLPGSGGSDEREKAGEYFLRTNSVGCDHYEEVQDYISICRTEYQCQVCKQWVRRDELRFIQKPRPHYACWDHPLPTLTDGGAQ